MRAFIFLAAVFTLLSCSNKIQVQHPAAFNNLDGKFFYALPANTLDVELKIKKESYTTGSLFEANKNCQDYIKAAKTYFGMDDALLLKLKSNPALVLSSLAKEGFAWTEGAVPDSQKIYVLTNKPSFLKDNSFSFAFNRDWLLSTSTLTTENKTFELVTTFLSTLVGTATSLLKSNTSSTLQPVEQICGGVFAPLIKLKKELEDFQLKPSPDLNEAALEMIRTKKQKQIEKMLEDLFFQKKEEITVHRLSLYIPQSFAVDGSTKFFRIDPSTGKLQINEALRSYLIWPKENSKLEFKPLTNADAGVYVIETRTHPFSVQNILASKFSTPSADATTGIVYNVPKTIRFYLIEDDSKEIIANSLFPVAQLGSVNTLDTRITKADFALDSLTGSLTKITMESKSFASDRITTTGNLIQQADSSIRKKTEVQKLEEEVKELELRAKKKELETKLQ